MPQKNKSDLLSLVNELRGAVARGPDHWLDATYDALGRVADAVHGAVGVVEDTSDRLGDINRDFQNVPVTQRHVETTRKRMIQLGEEAHQLRAEIRQAPGLPPLDVVQLRLRVEEVAGLIEKVEKDDEKFMLETANSNPGAGE